jgi:hypothetical protein
MPLCETLLSCVPILRFQSALQSPTELPAPVCVYPGMTQPDTWYVAFAPDNADDGKAARLTRRFKSEVDAKLFAMQILAKGWAASAGTLDPHQPEQVVGSSQIERWADPGLGG